MTLTGADIVDSAAQLGYVYDDAASLLEALQVVGEPTPIPARPPKLAAASEAPLELAGSTVSVSLTAAPSAQPLLESRRVLNGRVLVSVEDIEAERDPGLAYAELQEPGPARSVCWSHSSRLALCLQIPLCDLRRSDGIPCAPSRVAILRKAKSRCPRGRIEPVSVV